jgi:3'(2'),5'-bisphosphate nucleotidase
MDLGPIPTARPGLSYDEIAEILAEIALQAGPAIMRVYERGDPCARLKDDRSPVCEADELAEGVILEALAVRLPQWRVIAEESASRGVIPICGRGFLLVDPLDGTKEFLCRNGEFTVNIALIVDGTARAGAVYAPALGKLWFGGERAYTCDAKPGAPLPALSGRRELHVRPVPSHDIVALTSRSHLEADTESLLSGLPVGERRAIGSSIKFCLIAEGLGDFYPRFGPTMEWDVAEKRGLPQRAVRCLGRHRSRAGGRIHPRAVQRCCKGSLTTIWAKSALHLATGTSRLRHFCERICCRFDRRYFHAPDDPTGCDADLGRLRGGEPCCLGRRGRAPRHLFRERNRRQRPSLLRLDLARPRRGGRIGDPQMGPA